jgi:hypothetical protein
MAEAFDPPFNRPDRGFNDLPGWTWVGTYGGYYLQANRLADLPDFDCAALSVPCLTNPLGAKGVGEAGTTAALAAVMNAIADALPEGRGAALRMPATAEAIWRACRG